MTKKDLYKNQPCKSCPEKNTCKVSCSSYEKFVEQIPEEIFLYHDEKPNPEYGICLFCGRSLSNLDFCTNCESNL